MWNIGVSLSWIGIKTARVIQGLWSELRRCEITGQLLKTHVLFKTLVLSHM